MKVFETQSVLKTFYYLLAVDGDIDESELEHFHNIGMSIDPGHFGEYEETIKNECKLTLLKAEGDEYELILEGVDEALTREAPIDDQGLTPRLLVWDLFAAAYSNGVYNDYEKRLINHVSRKVEVEKSIVLEMEQMMNTLSSIQKEINWAKQVKRPNGEIQPIIDELEKRQGVITRAAEYLIADEIDHDNPYEYKPDFFDKTKDEIDKMVKPVTDKIGQTVKPVTDKVGTAVAPVTDKIGQTVKPVAQKVGSAVIPVASKAKDKTGEMFGKLAMKLNKNKKNDNNEEGT